MAIVEVPTKGAGDPFTTTMWGQSIQQNINELIGRSGGNLLVNGGFEHWQRGVGPFSTNNGYTADRWQYIDTGSAVGAVDRESSVIDTDSQYSLKLTVTTASGGQPTLRQVMEDWRQLRGKTISLQVRVRQSVATMVNIRINDGVSATNASSSATTGSFTTLAISGYTVSASATQLWIEINSNDAGTAYFDNMMLVIGPQATEYVPLHPQEDLARCQRYYEFIGGATSSVYLRAYQAASALLGSTVYYKVPKGGVPTVTKIGTWTVVNCGQPAVANPSPVSCNIIATVTALGDAAFTTSNATDGITVEWNPS
jgi:hypothetical protein